MLRALVTGGTGFIGAALVERLARPAEDDVEYDEIDCLVRPDNPRARRLDGLPRVRALPWSEFCAAARDCDVVFNAASYGVHPEDREPEAMLDGNLGLVARLLPLLDRRKNVSFVHLGSCAEYAPAASPYLVPEAHPLEPTTLYGAAKVATHVFATALARQVGVRSVTLRLFGTYGSGEASHRLLPALLGRLLRGQRASLSSGVQVRDFTFVDDVVEACLLVARRSAPLPHSVYNVCSGQPVTVAELAREVARQLAMDDAMLGLGELTLRTGEQLWLVGDPSRFREATGFMPRVDLPDGIARTIAAYRRVMT